MKTSINDIKNFFSLNFGEKANCSPGDDLPQQSWSQLGIHRITPTPDKCNTSVTGTATLSRYSSNEEPLKAKAMTIFHSDSLFSSNENLSVSDQEIAAYHMKSLPVTTQPSRIAGDCQEIYTSNKNFNLPETSSNRSPLGTSAHEEDLKTPNKAEKQIRGTKRLCSPEPCTESTSKKYKQGTSQKYKVHFVSNNLLLKVSPIYRHYFQVLLFFS